MRKGSMYQNVERKLLSLLKGSLKSYLSSCAVSRPLPPLFDTLTLEIPKEKGFGDLSSSAALRLSGLLRKDPKTIAGELVQRSKALSSRWAYRALVKDIQVKGAGFINIFLKDEVFHDLLRSVHREKGGGGRWEQRRRRKLLLEFVSANPTGALSIAHARQAAVGDALANILGRAGWRVKREYYLNDEGNQIDILGRSIYLRYRELTGEVIEFPEDHYQGAYITALARELYQDDVSKKKIEKVIGASREEFFTAYGMEKILAVIKKELDDFGVHFDDWYSQKKLGVSGKIEKALQRLKKSGFIYETEGAVWFKSTAFGDDKDRVVRKSDGSYTYLAPDIAYHEDKFRRGFEKLVNIWGPDHHGYVARLKAAIQALGEDKEALEVIIVQLATLFRQGAPVPMSTRKGQYITLTQLLKEVGRDASRFFFLMRKTDSPLDFDLELAKKQTSENPVYYVQYAHARIAGILAAAGEKGERTGDKKLFLLKEPEERDLMRMIFEFSYCLFLCAKQLDPYGLTVYLQALATAFHKFYDRHKVLSDDKDLTQARLFLTDSVRRILADGLSIIGVSAPDHM